MRHEAAVTSLREPVEAKVPLVTTSLVVAEAHGLVVRRMGRYHALRLLDRVHAGRRLLVVYTNKNPETQAEAILRRYDDQDFSLTDAVSLALMRERGISEAFAFDRHFTTAGFSLVPSLPS